MGFTMQVCKTWSCPALKQKKEPTDSDRDINSLLDKRSYKFEAKRLGVTPHSGWLAGWQSGLL